MTNELDEKQKLHKHFAALCFNECWNLIEDANRSEDEDEEMRRLSEASFWHWSRVEDHTKENLSVGYWQLARVYAISGQIKQAIKYAEKCIKISKKGDLSPFYFGYGYEAKARALAEDRQDEQAKNVLNVAYDVANTVSNDDEKKKLLEDLESIKVRDS